MIWINRNESAKNLFPNSIYSVLCAQYSRKCVIKSKKTRRIEKGRKPFFGGLFFQRPPPHQVYLNGNWLYYGITWIFFLRFRPTIVKFGTTYGLPMDCSYTFGIVFLNIQEENNCKFKIFDRLTANYHKLAVRLNEIYFKSLLLFFSYAISITLKTNRTRHRTHT